MLIKNIEKEKRKSKRKPTIPYTRKTLSKIEKIRKIENKHKGTEK